MGRDDMKLTPEQKYQKRYYEENKAKRTKSLRTRWRDDPVFRASEQARARSRRGRLRAERAAVRFEAMVAAKKLAGGATRPPRFININRVAVQVYTSGALGREVGRSPRAVRSWLRDGVLPGASAFIGGCAFFTREYCGAVWRACRRIYYLDGRGDRQVLRRIIVEELARARVSYVPIGGDNEDDRTVAAASAVEGE